MSLSSEILRKECFSQSSSSPYQSSLRISGISPDSHTRRGRCFVNYSMCNNEDYRTALTIFTT